MTKCGNHGQQVPRDRDWLVSLYWDDELTLPMIADLYGVEWSSVKKVFNELGIPRRGQGRQSAKWCVDCGIVKPRQIRHPINGSLHGTRCSICLERHRRALRDAYKPKLSQAEVRAKRGMQYDRWYTYGPRNPQGEDQWIRKSKALLRTTRRILKASRAASQSPSAAFAPAATSPT